MSTLAHRPCEMLGDWLAGHFLQISTSQRDSQFQICEVLFLIQKKKRKMVLKYILKVPHQCPKHHLKCQVIDFQVIHISLYDIVKGEST